MSLSRAVDSIITPDVPAESYTVTIGSDRPGLSSSRVRNVSDNEVVFVEFLHTLDTDEDGNTIEPPRKVWSSYVFPRDFESFVSYQVLSVVCICRCTNSPRCAMSDRSS
jgi:hypothetical protein